jgi:hypothetical protein
VQRQRRHRSGHTAPDDQHPGHGSVIVPALFVVVREPNL